MDKKSISYIPEIWGGIECSYNRVDDHFFDQLEYSRHYERGASDVEHFASLGIKAMRYPVIWERHQPKLRNTIDWSWTTQQLNLLKSKEVEPIAGLLHHGNGPKFTNLLHVGFAKLFASYARQVAKQFPWVQYYTPVNEPLTTARFTGLYGIWFPHKKRDKAFVTTFLNQMMATVLAMKAIREVNPLAKLIQSEDLGKTYSTTMLQYQADFENERRWLTYDMLCGLVDENHALWDYFKWLKVPDRILRFFQDNPCPPDIIGADHYLTSERFLDQKLSQYPAHTLGGNRKHRYADVEAIRVSHKKPSGLKVLLKECWERYKIPIAVTEVHINGDTNDQIRWFKEVWDTAIALNTEGVKIPAVTAWSLLGSFGWDRLLTVEKGSYEHGAFHLGADHELQRTPLADFITELQKNPEHTHAALNEKGWWQRESRYLYSVDGRTRPVRSIKKVAEVQIL